MNEQLKEFLQHELERQQKEFKTLADVPEASKDNFEHYREGVHKGQVQLCEFILTHFNNEPQR